MMLWLALGIMTVIATAVVVIPLIRRPRDDTEREAEHAANYRAYQQRSREIDAERADGQIGAEEAETAKNELARRLLADQQRDDDKHKVPSGKTRPWWAIIAVAIFVPIAAAALYWQQGSGQRYLDRQHLIARIQQGPNVKRMITELTAHLAREPDDVTAWSTLGDAYAAQQNYGAAANAFRHANDLSGNRDAELLVAQGVAQALAAHGDFQGATAHLFRAALKLDPSMPQALLYAGLAAYQAGQYREAVRHFQVLYQQPLSPRIKSTVRLHLNAARAQLGLPPIGATKMPQLAANGKTLQIPVRVTLSPSLGKTIPENAVVYIFARAAQGPNVPLAVVRVMAKDLPQTVDLSDSVSMVAGLKLSTYKSWIITARLSHNGDAGPAQPGDYQASVRVNKGQLPTIVYLTIAHPAGNGPP